MFEVIRELVDINKQNFANNIKILCIKKNEELASRLNFDQIDGFLHPALIAYMNHPNVEGGITFEQATSHLRNVDDYDKPFHVRSDRNKVVYLPELGYFSVDESNQDYTVNRLSSDEIEYTTLNGVVSTTKLIAEQVSSSKKMRIIPVLPANMTPNFKSFYKGNVVDENPGHLPRFAEATPKLNQAVGLLRKSHPELSELIESCNPTIFVHNNPRVLNYVERSVQGNICLYDLDESTAIYYLEELCHQGGHNILNLIASKQETLFKVPVDRMMIGQYINKPDDYRTIYSVIHGLVSIGYRVDVFDRLLLSGQLAGHSRYELIGRYADQISRFDTLGIELLNLENVYTEQAKEIFYPLFDRTKSLIDARRYEFSQFDMSWRDVDFSYGKFLEYNPISKCELAGIQ